MVGSGDDAWQGMVPGPLRPSVPSTSETPAQQDLPRADAELHLRPAGCLQPLAKAGPGQMSLGWAHDK